MDRQELRELQIVKNAALIVSGVLNYMAKKRGIDCNEFALVVLSRVCHEEYQAKGKMWGSWFCF